MSLATEVSKRWKSINWNLVFENKCKANKLFMRSGLIRKDLLPQYAPSTSLPSTFVFVPNSTKIPDLITFLEQTHKQLWITKPIDSSNGYEIYVHEVPSLARFLETCHEPTIVQEYLTPYLPPSLSLQHKYHFRALVLVVGTCNVYVYTPVRVLFAAEPYERQHWANPFIHLTNQSINREHPKYVSHVHNRSLDECHPWLNVRDVYLQMHESCRALFQRLLTRGKPHFFPLPNCYELFGFDFFLNEKEKVYLLEANPDPSLSMFPSTSSVHALGEYNVWEGHVPTDFELIFSYQQMQAFQLLKTKA